MKRKIIPVLIGCALSFSGLAAQPTAERYVVSFPEGAHVKYSGAFASAFPNGLPVGIGSGLLFTGKQGDALTFTTVTDRGPNADSPKMGKNDAKIFVTPNFAPLLMTIRVQNGKAEAVDARPLHDDKGEINGLPLQSGVIGSTNEIALSDTLKVLKGDNRGLDTEGITPDGKGGYWLCDEYGPFLINIDSKGKILAIHGPQATEGEKSIAGGLPNVIKWRQANRGFEGLTRMPDRRIIAAVQSTLDIDGKSKKQALFTRLVSFDPATGKTAMYGYPIDSAAYSKNSDAKIGDIVALDNLLLRCCWQWHPVGEHIGVVGLVFKICPAICHIIPAQDLLISPFYIIGVVVKKDRIRRRESFFLQYCLIDARLRFTHPHLLGEIHLICRCVDFRVFIRPEGGMQAVGIRQDDDAMPLLAQLVHDVDHFRADRDKNRLPAVGKLLVA